MNRELESTAPTAMADKNFFIIASRYMILQARYGYHFCTVECLAGEDEHENFVSFQFKGGAADVSRRILRAGMLATCWRATASVWTSRMTPCLPWRKRTTPKRPCAGRA